MKRLFNTIIILLSLLFIFSYNHKIEACSTNSGEILNLINSYRTQNGLTQLTMDSNLVKAANIRSQEISIKFSHTRPDGSQWYSIDNNIYGENLARANNEEQSKSANIVLAWYLSSNHKYNILCSYYKRVGISYYTNNGTTYIVAEFGL